MAVTSFPLAPDHQKKSALAIARDYLAQLYQKVIQTGAPLFATWDTTTPAAGTGTPRSR